jgi:hypothetical protein
VTAVAAAAGCSEKIVEKQARLGGSCLACHEGITDIHPDFALSCTDCHGGNDQVAMPAVVNIRDQDLLKKSHVLPLDPEMWWANGIDDNGDGRVDEVGEFFDGRTVDQDGNAGLAEARLAKRSQLDSEMNHDVNYLRWLNPGDLRVAQVGCGNKNKNANAAMVCHAEVVYDMRRSIMTTQAGVISGANYGNAQLPRSADFAPLAGTDVGDRFDARNPRIGRVGYTFNYDVLDEAFSGDVTDPTRNLVTGSFDHAVLLEEAGRNQDPNDDLFEVTAAPVFDDGSDPLDPGPGFTRTGQKLKFFNRDDTADNRAVEVLSNVGNAAFRTFPPRGSSMELRLQTLLGLSRNAVLTNLFDGQPITNPVDAALRVFRAYHPMNSVSPADNFGFVDFTTSPNEDDPPPQDPNDVELRNKNNPFGRFRPSGCSSCRVPYANDGHNRELPRHPRSRAAQSLVRRAPAAHRLRRRQRRHPLGRRAHRGRHALRGLPLLLAPRRRQHLHAQLPRRTARVRRLPRHALRARQPEDERPQRRRRHGTTRLARRGHRSRAGARAARGAAPDRTGGTPARRWCRRSPPSWCPPDRGPPSWRRAPSR